MEKPEEISDIIKSYLGPNGDLYLTPSKAGDLIRWMQLMERSWKEQEKCVRELQKIMKIAHE